MHLTSQNRLLNLANCIRENTLRLSTENKSRKVLHLSQTGDAQFIIDYQAEEIAQNIIKKHFNDCRLYSEDYQDNAGFEKPYLLLIDPIDGSRPAAASLEMATISIAIAKNMIDASFSDIEEALIMEIKSGAWVYRHKNSNHLHSSGFQTDFPNPNTHANLKHMFWTFELNGHPSHLIVNKIGALIDYTANTGGVFIFNSATYSILKILTGQLDAYIDIGNRLLKDNQNLLDAFKKVGNGHVLHLFPYDLAAIYFIAAKSTITITDGYGQSLANTKLLSFDWQNQQSCIAAATTALHKEIFDTIGYSTSLPL